jgi:hypothetical protein
MPLRSNRHRCSPQIGGTSTRASRTAMHPHFKGQSRLESPPRGATWHAPGAIDRRSPVVYPKIPRKRCWPPSAFYLLTSANQISPVRTSTLCLIVVCLPARTLSRVTTGVPPINYKYPAGYSAFSRGEGLARLARTIQSLKYINVES